MREIGADDVADIALGSSLLGSGGGGDPYMGTLETYHAIKTFGPVTLYDVDEVPDDWTVAPIGGVGAPSVSMEKGTNGLEYGLCVEYFEKAIGKKVDAFLLSEAGGLNSLVPFAAGARLDMPVIDADGMGRAFPGIQQDTFNLNGISPTPFVATNEQGNVAVLYTVSPDWSERIGRHVSTAFGGQSITITSPMSGAKMKTSVVRGTVTLTQRIGRAIRHAPHASADEAPTPQDYFMRQTGALPLFEGKITDVLRETRDGFNFGRATLEGIGADKGSSCLVEFQNENLYVEVDGTIVATVPDLICMVDRETFVPVTTEKLKYGKRVLVVGMKCDAAWRTPRGLELAGPRWFGLDVDYVPIEQRLAQR
jgi:DUF917 family protein